MNKKFCQSCSMPLESAEQFGTNANGSKNEEYCLYCYKDGKFINPEITMEEMIDKCAGILAGIKNISIEEAKFFMEGVIPNLKRWKE
jgi:hypothetical protein